MIILATGTAVLTSSHYRDTCFAVLVCFIGKDVGVLIIVACCIVRFPFTSADFGSTDRISFGVVTVDVTTFFLVVVIMCTGQTTSGTLINSNVMPIARVICVDRAGYLIVSAVTSVAAYFLATRTTINIQVTTACAILSEVIVFGAECGVVSVIAFAVVIAILTSGDYGNTCFTGLIGFICKGVGVLILVMCASLRFPTAGTDFNASDRIGVSVVTVGEATFSCIIILVCAAQTTLGTFIELFVVRNTCIVGVVRRGYAGSATTSINTR